MPMLRNVMYLYDNLYSLLCYVMLFLCYVMFTLRASEAAAQCSVIGPVCGFVCVFVGLLPR